MLLLQITELETTQSCECLLEKTLLLMKLNRLTNTKTCVRSWTNAQSL